MKTIVLFATVLLVAICVNGAQSAAARRRSSQGKKDLINHVKLQNGLTCFSLLPSTVEDEKTDLPRVFFDKLSGLKGGHSSGGSDDKEIIVVYLKGGKGGKGGKKRPTRPHHDDDDEDDDDEVIVRPPKHHPGKWEVHEDDDDDYEYVRPVKVKKIIKQPIYIDAGDSSSHGDKWGSLTDKFSHGSGSGSNSWKDWIGQKFGNKFNKGGNGHDDDDHQIIVVKKGGKKGGYSHYDDSDDDEGYTKWEKYD